MVRRFHTETGNESHEEEQTERCQLKEVGFDKSTTVKMAGQIFHERDISILSSKLGN